MTTGTETHRAEAQARRLERVSEQLTTWLRHPDVASRLRLAPGADEWSAMQVLGHVVEMIPYWLNQCRDLIAAAGAPPQFGRAPDAPERLAGVERGATGDADELLRRLQAEVQTAATAIRQMSPAERGRRGIHLRRGEMAVADVIEVFIVAHAEDHLAQVRAALRM